jgi:hypothetical protein
MMRFGFWNVPAEMSVGHTAAGKVLLAEILLVDVLLVEVLLAEVLLGDVGTGAVRVGVDVAVGVGVIDDDEEDDLPRAVQPYPTLIVMLSQP